MTFILPTLAVGFAAFCVWLSRWLSSRWAPRAKRPIVPIVALLLISAACMRWELFAPESAPPASAWRDDHHLFDNAEPLQNLPVVVSTAIRKWGLSVTVANRGAATLINGRSAPHAFIRSIGRAIVPHGQIHFNRGWLVGLDHFARLIARD